jgi:hypothetical protein
MKKSLFGLLIVCISCSQIDHIASEQYPQKWKLTEMSGSVANIPPSTGSDMEWQEYYLLNADGTFIKHRERDYEVKVESGIYNFINLSDGKYLELVYPSDNELVGNCTQEPIEILKLNSVNKLIGTWWACDGPGLKYERVE